MSHLMRESDMQKVVIGNATLYLGDCLQVLPSLDGVDAVITDPPYGIALANHGRSSKDYRIAGDGDQEVGNLVREWAEKIGAQTVFFAAPNKPWPGEWRNYLVWDKGGAVGGGGDIATCWKKTWELIQVARNKPLLGARDEAVVRVLATPSISAQHPAAKPIQLMTYLVGKIDAEVILDPFMGSGTTGVAAIQLGRKFVGIEREPKYFELSCHRIAQAVAQGRLFEPEAPKQEQTGLFGEAA